MMAFTFVILSMVNVVKMTKNVLFVLNYYIEIDGNASSKKF